MKNVVWGVVIVAILGVAYYGVLPVVKNVGDKGANAGQEQGNKITAQFYSYAFEGGVLDVVFDNDAETATVDGAGLTGVVLPRAISASGARYENTELGVELWNKGDEVTVKRGEETVFYGTTNVEEAVAISSLQYVHATDWPALVLHSDDEYTCTNAGTETDRAGGTEEREINGAMYCVTVSAEGAAGSVYRQYAYMRADENGGTQTATFSFRFPQCMNYDEPQQSACVAEEDAFNADTLLPFIHF